MITIIVADDEKLIRAGISKILKDSIDVPLEILEAKNGQEAVELCKTEHPNVLITDIRMPIMDGVELMKNVSQMENAPAIIVLSGFDDFVYAKAAIQSGAMSYILKPVDKKELINSVEKAIAEFRVVEQKRNEETLKNIIDEGRIAKSTEIAGYNFKTGFYCINVVGNHAKDKVSKVFDGLDYYTLESKKDFECLVIPREAIYLVEQELSFGQYIVGISEAADNISSLRTYKKQAFIACLQSFYPKEGTGSTPRETGIFRFTDIPEDADYSKIDDVYERIVSKLSISSSEEIQKGMKKLFNYAEGNSEIRACRLDYLYSKILSNLFSRFPSYSETDMYLHLKSIMIENIFEFRKINEWKTCVQDYAIYLAALLKKDTTEYPFIDEAISYLKANFNKNINMAMVANQVSVNYTWFSEKFKEHTGVNFNEYLKRLRMEEACRLLEKGCYKVYEVAEKSGFGDVKYFMKTFKESTGVSPGEWKRLHCE